MLYYLALPSFVKGLGERVNKDIDKVFLLCLQTIPTSELPGNIT